MIRLHLQPLCVCVCERGSVCGLILYFMTFSAKALADVWPSNKNKAFTWVKMDWQQPIVSGSAAPGLTHQQWRHPWGREFTFAQKCLWSFLSLQESLLRCHHAGQVLLPSKIRKISQSRLSSYEGGLVCPLVADCGKMKGPSSLLQLVFISVLFFYMKWSFITCLKIKRASPRPCGTQFQTGRECFLCFVLFFTYVWL